MIDTPRGGGIRENLSQLRAISSQEDDVWAQTCVDGRARTNSGEEEEARIIRERRGDVTERGTQ